MEIKEQKDYRKDFPLLNNNSSIYIDNAATAQKPQCVIDAESRFYEVNNANPLRGFYPLSLAATKEYEDAREVVRQFLNADSDKEIIFTRNTTESLNLVAYSYGINNLKAGDEIAVSIMEHHSNLLPWQMVARVTGATLRYLECEKDGTLKDDTLKDGINANTKIVAVAQVSNVLGCVNPIKKIAKIAHDNGAVMVVDAAQSAPHMKIDVKDLDADFLAFSGHKLMGPMGIGVLYGKESILKNMQPFLQAGKAELVYTDEQGNESRELIHNFKGAGIIQGMHNLNDSIENFARSCFNFALETKQDLWFATKDTISKKVRSYI